MHKVDVVVMAGGCVTDTDITCAGTDNCRSLIIFRERPLIHWVLKALRGSARVNRIVVVGPESIDDQQIDTMYDKLLPEASNEIDGLLNGMHAFPDSDRILVVAGNMPFLSAEAVTDFVDNSMDGDVVYATVAKSDVISRFPDREWTFLPMADGALRGSGTALFRPQVFREQEDVLRRVYDARNECVRALEDLRFRNSTQVCSRESLTRRRR